MVSNILPAETVLARISKLRQRMKDEDVDLFVLQNRQNISYFSGLENISGHLFIGQTDPPLFYVVDKQFRQALDLGPKLIRLEKGQSDYRDELVEELMNRVVGDRRVAFDQLDVYNYRRITERVNIIPMLGASIIRGLQRFYDQDEMVLVRKAASIADAGFKAARETLRPGVTELEVLGQMQYTFRKEGSDWDTFRVFGSGPNSAYSEALPTNRTIQRGDMVFIDIGPSYRGYRADMTRTFIVGKPSSQQRRILDGLIEVESKAIELARAGIEAHELDAQVRRLVTDRGFNDYLHHTGHALSGAFEIVPGSEAHLESGDVVCLEPGIYVPGVGGGRLEDELLVGQGLPELITHASRDPYVAV